MLARMSARKKTGKTVASKETARKKSPTKAAKTARKRPASKKAAPKKAASKKANSKKANSKKAAPKKAAPKKAAPKKAAPKKAAPKKAAPKKAAPKKAAPKKAASKKAASKKAASKKAASKKAASKKAAAKKPAAKQAAPKKARANEAAGDKANGALSPVSARPTRGERDKVRERVSEIDLTCNAWATIVAERMNADQNFADLVDQFRAQPPRDLRGLFLMDALQAAEAHVAVITQVLGEHLEGRRGDPVIILDEIRKRQKRIAAVYAVNAFLAVLNQMKPEKPKWQAFDALDPRFAVLALAHQTLGYALEAAQIVAPPDVTEQIINATQDEAVWVWRRMPEPGTDTLAACAAAAAFFRHLGAESMVTTDEVAAFYAEQNTQRPS
ncbi:MAG: hypothetical protein SangKO_042670 [Sandaracinaceae bacterium]